MTYTFQVKVTDNVDNVSGWAQSDPVKVEAVTKYYAFGGSKVAMSRGDEVYYLHGDHLGSTSLTTDSNGEKVSEAGYLPYGEERLPNQASVTDFGFTAQRNEKSFGLMDYNARYYSPVLGRFISPDSIVPDPTSSGGFNRYRYTRNNPLKYTDPSGHCEEFGDDACWSAYDRLKNDCPECEVLPHTNNTPLEDASLDDLNAARTLLKDEYIPRSAFQYRNPDEFETLFETVANLITPDRGTLSIGYGGAIFGIVGGRGGGSINFDTHGNFSILGGGGGGGYTALGGNLGPNVMITGAPTVDYLDETSVQLGGSVAKFAAVGGEWVILPQDSGEAYHGINLMPIRAGDNEPVPFEVHFTVEQDTVLYRDNIFDIVNRFIGQ